jgi:hypothetical protein
MENLKKFSDYLLKGGIDRETGIKLLRETDKLNPEDKLLIYSYCYPRRILDYELPKHIQYYRQSKGNSGIGWLQENLGESCILVEAYRDTQYGRFMRHLMHAFLDLEKLSSCSGEGETTCPICGKTIYYYDSVKPEDLERETEAIMSSESSVCLCKDCLAQLLYSKELIAKIEGPDFLIPKWKNSGVKV